MYFYDEYFCFLETKSVERVPKTVYLNHLNISAGGEQQEYSKYTCTRAESLWQQHGPIKFLKKAGIVTTERRV